MSFTFVDSPSTSPLLAPFNALGLSNPSRLKRTLSDSSIEPTDSEEPSSSRKSKRVKVQQALSLGVGKENIPPHRLLPSPARRRQSSTRRVAVSFKPLSTRIPKDLPTIATTSWLGESDPVTSLSKEDTSTDSSSSPSSL